MHITKPTGYDQFIAHFDPVGLTGLGTSHDDARALLWALISGDLVRKYQVTNSRLSWLVAAVEQYKQLRQSSSWTVKMEALQRLQDSESFQRLLSYGASEEELRQVRSKAWRALSAHRELHPSGSRPKSPAALRRRRRKMYNDFVRMTAFAVENGILEFGKRVRK